MCRRVRCFRQPDAARTRRLTSSPSTCKRRASWTGVLWNGLPQANLRCNTTQYASSPPQLTSYRKNKCALRSERDTLIPDLPIVVPIQNRQVWVKENPDFRRIRCYRVGSPSATDFGSGSGKLPCSELVSRFSNLVSPAFQALAHENELVPPRRR